MRSPIFIQIRDDLKKRIEDGEFKNGSRLPSERELSEEYQVSRMTLRQALNTLVTDGILEKRTGSGSYVKEKPVTENLRGVTSFSQLMIQSGITASTQFISYKREKPTPTIIKALKLEANEEIIILERLRLGDGEPIAYEIAFLPERIVGKIKTEEFRKSLYQALENHGYPVSNAKAVQDFNATIADRKVAEILGIKVGDPILYLTQITSNPSQRPFEFVRTYYVGTRYHIHLEQNGFK
ncbi:MAG: GntR family transcriptional regulator [Lactobacillaceae bacterium]|jgi:GntR family transcriptional regulator|nr:GntR family transcriptional regulator [Lactobacillaceae bacterium]